MVLDSANSLLSKNILSKIILIEKNIEVVKKFNNITYHYSIKKFENILKKLEELNINKVLIIGGSTYEGKVYQTFYEVKEVIQDYGFEMYCGVYPQSENLNNVEMSKYQHFTGGITQLCLNPRLLNSWSVKTRIGVPTNCTLKGLYKYAKLCGLLDSLTYALGNLGGVRYVSKDGFDTMRFVNDLNGQPLHLYNFGKLDQTLMQLTFS